ncbi:MAG: hypothetical protein CM15mP74_08450 [Halieaceae bacterium]|nr:MAG: hypothetical protein CM15mP74_08450 [Halieaceae bacterium]
MTKAPTLAMTQRPSCQPSYRKLFDDTVGIALSGTFRSVILAWLRPSILSGWSDEGSGILDNGQQTNLPSETAIVALPQQMVYQLDEWERTRINGQLTLQWRPVESVTATLDYTMAELELDHRYNAMSVWFSPTGQSGTWSDGPIVSPLVYTETNNQPDRPMAAGVDASKNTRDGIGLNIEWDITDRLRVALTTTTQRPRESPTAFTAARPIFRWPPSEEIPPVLTTTAKYR